MKHNAESATVKTLMETKYSLCSPKTAHRIAKIQGVTILYQIVLHKHKFPVKKNLLFKPFFLFFTFISLQSTLQ